MRKAGSVTYGVSHADSSGTLIVRFVNINPPTPPTCIKVSCLWKFFLDSLTFALISSYHGRRIAFAEASRGKEILERYRTGEPSPETLWQAFHANIKLTCPICRKYNVDPFIK